MKKSSFTALILGTISGMLFALGMCMVLIPEWNARQPGIIFGGIGIALALATLIVWRKMEHKKPMRLSGRATFALLVGMIGALALGIGMCFSMVWGKMVLGIVLGLLGILILLSLIPLIKGLKE